MNIPKQLTVPPMPSNTVRAIKLVRVSPVYDNNKSVVSLRCDNCGEVISFADFNIVFSCPKCNESFLDWKRIGKDGFELDFYSREEV